MKKKFITYKMAGKIKKAVLDENMYRNYKANPQIVEVEEYENEMLMEKSYALKVGSLNNKQTLLD